FRRYQLACLRRGSGTTIAGPARAPASRSLSADAGSAGHDTQAGRQRAGAGHPVYRRQDCPTSGRRDSLADLRYVPKKSLNARVAADIRAVFDAPDAVEAQRLFERLLTTYETPLRLIWWPGLR